MRTIKSIAIIALMLAVVSSSLVYSDLSVLYRTDFPTYELVSPTIWSCGLCDRGGANDHIRSNAGSSIDSFPVTLQYNDKIDFISWHVINPSKVPEDTVLYIYMFFSQISIASGSKATLCGFVQYDGTSTFGIFLIMSDT